MYFCVYPCKNADSSGSSLAHTHMHTHTCTHTHTHVHTCIRTYMHNVQQSRQTNITLSSSFICIHINTPNLRTHTYIYRRHDTTAFMLSWTLIEIYRNPKVLESLRAELDAVNPDRTGQHRHWSPEQLRSLKYLDATINEGMR
jgi:hypothetical protein